MIRTNRVKVIESRTIRQAHIVPAVLWNTTEFEDVVKFAMESAWAWLQDRFPDGKLIESSVAVKTYAPGEWDYEEFDVSHSPEHYGLILTTAEVLL